MKRSIFIILMSVAVIFAANQEDKLQSLSRQIDDLKTKIELLKKVKGSLLNEIYTIELQYEKVKIESNKVELQLRRTRRKINIKEAEKNKLELEIQNSKTKIKQVIRILYKMGTGAYIKLFIKINSFDQLFSNYRLLISLVDFNLVEIKKVKVKIDKLEKIKKDLELEYVQISNLKKSKDYKLYKIQSFKQDKLKLINKLNQDKTKHLKLLSELKFEAERLNNFMLKKGASKKFFIADIERLKGKLIWPLNGKVISSFGRKKSKRFNTYTFNNGIKIKPFRSEEIRSVYEGEIIFADYHLGYGKLIIIEHSSNFHSLYGHCEKFFKKQGDVVQKGELIALAGDTGSALGKTLHFEIRKDIKAQDPLKWLTKNK
jgi:septal ring factor EnvC (AmiA/AmiB activator)